MAAAMRTQQSRGLGGARKSRRRPNGKANAAARSGARILTDMNEVLAAIQSLYIDHLRPFGRILRKRLAERAAAAGLGPLDIDMECLRATCTSCPWLRVEDTEGGDWTALFTCYPEAFVDIYSPEDVYPQELWEAAAEYFEGLDDKLMVLPGGRYSCAQELAGRRPAFLWGYSLGQVSHIVQLAISQKKLLGYLNGELVPYARSASMVKDRCAACQRPCVALAPSPGALVDWEHLRVCLKVLMERVPLSGSMPLSNVKRLFRSRFRMELSETALGHSKLSELLSDPNLRDICLVRLQGHGCVVVHPRQPVQATHFASDHMTQVGEVCEEGSLHVSFVDYDEVRQPSPKHIPDSELLMPFKIRNTFIHIDDELLCVTPSAKKAPLRSKTAPVAIVSDPEEEDDDYSSDGNRRMSEDVEGNDSCSTVPSPEAGLQSGAGDQTFCTWHSSSFGFAERREEEPSPHDPTEPVHLMTITTSEEISFSESKGEAVRVALPSQAMGSPTSSRRSSSSKCPSLSPRVFMVQNTFIHIEADPATPWMSAARKAKTTTHASSAVKTVGFGM